MPMRAAGPEDKRGPCTDMPSAVSRLQLVLDAIPGITQST